MLIKLEYGVFVATEQVREIELDFDPDDGTRIARITFNDDTMKIHRVGENFEEYLLHATARVIPADPAWKLAVYEPEDDSVYYKTVISFSVGYNGKPSPHCWDDESAGGTHSMDPSLTALVDPSTGKFCSAVAGVVENEAKFKVAAALAYEDMKRQRKVDEEREKVQREKRKAQETASK